MRRSFVVLFAACSALTVPAVAQKAETTAAADAVNSAAQPKKVKKRVCTKVEAVTGSRTNGRSQVCKTVEVTETASTASDKGHEGHEIAGATD